PLPVHVAEGSASSARVGGVRWSRSGIFHARNSAALEAKDWGGPTRRRLVGDEPAKGRSGMAYARRLAATLRPAVGLLGGAALATGVAGFATEPAPVGLDTHKVTAFSSFVVIGQLYDSLVEVDASLAVEPALAESWEVSDDGLTYVVQIRQG